MLSPSLPAWPRPFSCSVYDSQKMQARCKGSCLPAPARWPTLLHCCPHCSFSRNRPPLLVVCQLPRSILRSFKFCGACCPLQAFTSSLFLAGLFSSLFAAKITQKWGRKVSRAPPIPPSSPPVPPEAEERRTQGPWRHRAPTVAGCSTHLCCLLCSQGCVLRRCRSDTRWPCVPLPLPIADDHDPGLHLVPHRRGPDLWCRRDWWVWGWSRRRPAERGLGLSPGWTFTRHTGEC